MNMRDQGRRLSLIVLVVLCIYGVASNFQAISERLRPPDIQSVKVVASEYFIDVWKLRADVAALELLQTTDNTDSCNREGKVEAEIPNQPPRGPQEIEQYKLAAQQRVDKEQDCIADVAKRYKAYTQALEAFNRTWVPALTKAIESGDPVAEVIMRQCSTTSILDRSKIESTCDANFERRTAAAKRLHEIGFAPAFDWKFEVENRKKTDPEQIKTAKLFADQYLNQAEYERWQRRANRELLLEQFEQGAYGFYGSHREEFADNDQGFNQHHLILALLQSAPRAFTFSPLLDARAAAEFGSLRLVRKPLTPGVLTWGTALYSGYDDKPAITGDNGFSKWRSGNVGKAHYEAAPYDAVSAVRKHVDASEANIDRYLRQEPRWGVFLLHRIGHHEWVPERAESDTHKLTSDWAGEWKLEKTFEDWKDTASYIIVVRGSAKPREQEAMPRGAQVVRDGEFARITFKTGNLREALRDDSCLLRYSGGLTYVPRAAMQDAKDGQPNQANEQDWSHTLFGDLRRDHSNDVFVSGAGCRQPGGSQCKATDSNGAAFAPLNSGKPYKQVLVLCDEGESLDSDYVRFLLLEGDMLVEFAASDPFMRTFYVRHYRRLATQPAEPVAAK